MRFQGQDVIELSRGASRLRVAPQAGGRLLSWTIDGAPVLYWPDAPDWSQPGGIRGGNPLLFPFIARHWVNGEMGAWRDASGAVREMPLHGFARDLPFAAQVAPEADGVRMTLADSAATRERYPFGFRFEAAYGLVEDGEKRALDVELVTTNTGDTPLPYYAGHHFYFALPHAGRAQTTIALPRNAWRRQLPDGTTTEATPGATHYRLDDAQIVDRFHCLDGAPDAPVRIEMPQQGRAIDIDLHRPDSTDWYAVTTWTLAPDSDFYCVEPWLGLPDAIHTGLGLRWLKPGEIQRAALRITVSALR